MTADLFFRMTVDDVFTVRGQGSVVTGRIESGTFKVGDEIRVVRAGGSARTMTVAGLEMFSKLLNAAQAGDVVGMLLRGIEKNDIQHGDVLLGG